MLCLKGILLAGKIGRSFLIRMCGSRRAYIRVLSESRGFSAGPLFFIHNTDTGEDKRRATLNLVG